MVSVSINNEIFRPDYNRPHPRPLSKGEGRRPYNFLEKEERYISIISKFCNTETVLLLFLGNIWITRSIYPNPSKLLKNLDRIILILQNYCINSTALSKIIRSIWIFRPRYPDNSRLLYKPDRVIPINPNWAINSTLFSTCRRVHLINSTCYTCYFVNPTEFIPAFRVIFSLNNIFFN